MYELLVLLSILVGAIGGFLFGRISGCNYALRVINEEHSYQVQQGGVMSSTANTLIGFIARRVRSGQYTESRESREHWKRVKAERENV